MSKVKKPTRIQKSRASKNSLYMTTFILLVALIFGLPTGAYIYMANTHKPTQTTQADKQVQKIKQDKLPKPKEASEDNAIDQDASSSTESTTSIDDEDINTGTSTTTAVDDGTTYSSSSSNRMLNADANTDVDGTYTVKQGDNLYRIAVDHGMTQQELMDLNGLTVPAVSVGQVLKVR